MRDELVLEQQNHDSHNHSGHNCENELLKRRHVSDDIRKPSHKAEDECQHGSQYQHAETELAIAIRRCESAYHKLDSLLRGLCEGHRAAETGNCEACELVHCRCSFSVSGCWWGLLPVFQTAPYPYR